MDANLCSFFFLLFVYFFYCRWRSNYHIRRKVVPLTGLIPLQSCACHKSGHVVLFISWIPMQTEGNFLWQVSWIPMQTEGNFLWQVSWIPMQTEGNFLWQVSYETDVYTVMVNNSTNTNQTTKPTTTSHLKSMDANLCSFFFYCLFIFFIVAGDPTII
jgi:hypothetical protein